jgi:hypothetical protein
MVRYMMFFFIAGLPWSLLWPFLVIRGTTCWDQSVVGDQIRLEAMNLRKDLERLAVGKRTGELTMGKKTQMNIMRFIP